MDTNLGSLSKWKRTHYENAIVKVFPKHAEQVYSMNDVELMNCYYSDNWNEWKSFMKKVLIANVDLICIKDILCKMLNLVEDSFYDIHDKPEFREDPIVHNACLELEGKDVGRYFPHILRFKIIEIPDNVEYEVHQQECNISEYIEEKHRVWGECAFEEYED